MIVEGMIAGAGLGVGLLLVARGLLAGPRPLAEALRALSGVADVAGTVSGGGWAQTAGRWLGRRLAEAGIDLAAVDADLAVMGRSREQHLVAKLAGGLAGLAVPVVAALAATTVGVGVTLPTVVVAAVAVAAAGFVLPDVVLRRRAAERRRGFRFALSSYLDLVHVLLAAGSGVETALAEAADAGRGWAFEQLSAALRRCQLTGDNPWRSLARTGQELDMAELREVAAALALAGTHGARVRASLEARASSLRARELADIEATAEAATERMALPSVVLVVAFVVFVGYPAAFSIVGL